MLKITCAIWCILLAAALYTSPKVAHWVRVIGGAGLIASAASLIDLRLREIGKP